MAGNYDYQGSNRLAAGTLTVAQLDATFEVEKFPRAADQPAILDWAVTEPDGLYSKVAELVEAIDGSIGGFGNAETEIVFGPITPLMVNHLWTVIMTGKFSAPVTAMVFDRAFGWRVVNATAQWPDVRSLQAIGFGYENFKLRLVDAVEAPPGFGFTIGFSIGHNA